MVPELPATHSLRRCFFSTCLALLLFTSASSLSRRSMQASQIRELWVTFSHFNTEKIKGLDNNVKDNLELRAQADVELVNLLRLQDQKEEEKNVLKGRLSAILK